ncbi:hypothetical protein [Paraburkholderia lycopersici]|uniref:Uncharacterized protein n=1 Tax=Paraburkholderia lycopersici TaxID=416944 RepID=A0A1G6NDX5_9BURK|nr:hypothetical protein [Paraburkholderia lycopersici]SDC65385.1 hypothetical protein SAMN05421548_1094 [Paraburkholderia lycopersici]
MKVLHCLVIAMSLCAASAYAQGNHAHPSAADENAVTNQNAPENQGFGRVQHDKPADKKDECVGPVSFCNIYFGS